MRRSNAADAALRPSFPWGPGLGIGGGPGTWLGGDGGRGCSIGPGRYFFAFSDTYLGPPGGTTRRPFGQGGGVGNSISIYDVDADRNAYYWRGTPDAPRPFFEDYPGAPPGQRFWCGRSFTVGPKLFVMLSRIHPERDPKTRRNANRYRETLIARVANPTDPPDRWAIDYLDLGLTGFPIYGANGEALVSGADLYLFGVTSPDPMATETAAIRLPVASLLAAPQGSSLGAQVTYLDRFYKWSPGFAGDPMDQGDGLGLNAALHYDYWRVGIRTPLGFTIRWNGRINRWQAVTVDSRAEWQEHWQPSGNPNPRSVICMTSRRGPFGPWSAPRKIFQFPDFVAAGPRPPGGLHCYAVAECPDFASGPDVIRFTYSSSTSGPSGAARPDSPEFYGVRVAEVPNPF